MGILTDLFGSVWRGPLWHPHSITALGADAADFASERNAWRLPVPERAVGVNSMTEGQGPFLESTLIHAVEEWAQVGASTDYRLFKIRTRTAGFGSVCVATRHNSQYLRQLRQVDYTLAQTGIAVQGTIGDAKSILVDVVPMVDLTMEFLQRNPDLFLDREPVPKEWY